MMPTPNPKVAVQLQKAKEELARLKEEKLRVYPPNPNPLARSDSYPRDYTDDQIRQRNELVRQLEALEQRVDALQDQLYQK